MYMCIFIYTYVYIYIYTCIYTYIRGLRQLVVHARKRGAATALEATQGQILTQSPTDAASGR